MEEGKWCHSDNEHNHNLSQSIWCNRKLTNYAKKYIDLCD